jgi:hypothetical protein
VLAYNQMNFTPEQRAQLILFHDGHQWDESIMERRFKMGRPCLVVNRVLLIVQEMLNRTRAMGQPDLTYSEIELLSCIVAYRNMDAQRLYNVQLSSLAETIRANRQSAGKRIVSAMV